MHLNVKSLRAFLTHVPHVTWKVTALEAHLDACREFRWAQSVDLGEYYMVGPSHIATCLALCYDPAHLCPRVITHNPFD